MSAETGSRSLSQPPLLSVGLVSAAALAYEILLMRLFSIIQWHHFAYMMISLALLGFGASGTFLFLVRNWLKGRFRIAFVVNAAMFGVTAIGCFLLAQWLPFNALEILWDPRQAVWMLLTYLLLFLPFFCAANCICLCFGAFRQALNRVYAADLIGAGLGAAGAIGLLYIASPMQALAVIGLTGVGAAMVAMLELRFRKPLIPMLALTGLCLSLAPSFGFEPRLSPFKGLSQALSVTGAKIIDQRSGPLGVLTTVENPVVPFRHAPGLSLDNPVEPPEQLAVFTDGDAQTMINRVTGAGESLSFLDRVTSAMAYHVLETPAVLVLGAGGGTEVLQALQLGATEVDAVELNPQMADLLRHEYAGFSGHLFRSGQVTVHEREARGFVASSERSWDLVQMALMDSFGASSAGLHALNENYLYTIEAFGQYLQRLRPGGIISVTRWLKLPPRDGMKMFATAIEALERRGVAAPESHLAMIRSWNTTTLLVSERPLTSYQVDRIRAFADQRWFDLAWYPGMKRDEANRFNQLREPWFFDGAASLAGPGRKQFIEDYKFNVRPATDDRPHYFNFLKWRTVPEILSLRGRGGLPLLEQGYLLVVATLVQALLVSAVLLLAPLWFVGRATPSRVDGDTGSMGRILLYFTAIGTGFMLIEIAFIQKFVLFLSHPLYAVAVVLAAFLVFAGLGSALSARLTARRFPGQVVAGIAVLAILNLLLLPWLFRSMIGLGDTWKILTTVILISPLALLLGMPFPVGLQRVARNSPGCIPWAWAANGCASVVSAVLATVLAIHVGFNTVVLLALAIYGLAARTVPR